MIERRVWFEAVGQKLVHKPVIEIQTFGIRHTLSVRKYSWPRYRKPIGLDAHFLCQANVFLVSVIVIVGLVGIAVIANLARRVRERIPNRASSTVFIHCALNLVRGSGGTPDEPVRKPDSRVSI